MADDRRLRISSSRAHPDEVARHTFGTTRRGYDPAEVRAYLELLAGELEVAAERERELRDLAAEAEHRAANPVLDEATLTAALGQETARVLRSAHDAAADVVARADSEAELLRTSAIEESSALRARAEQLAAERTSQAEAAIEDRRARTQQEIAAALDKARLESEALLAQARAECRAMVQEAQDLRAKVLADLTRRRRVLHSQIEQLRAGRERLAETIAGVRSTVDTITDELFHAEDEARLAAEEAGRQLAASASAEPDVEEELAVAVAAAPGTAVEAQTASAEPPAAAPTGGPEVAGTAEAGLVAEPEVQDEEVRKQAVEDLFARLRAGRSAEEAVSPGAHEALAVAVAVDSAEEQTPEQAPEPVATKPGRAAARRKEGSAKRGAPKASAVEPAAPEPPTSAADEPVALQEEPAPGDDVSAADEADPDLVRRDGLLTPVVSAMARRLKRALQDDQNDILDRLRGSGRWGPEVLPNIEDHLARYSGAAIEQLREAAGSGASFAGGAAADAPDVAQLSNELALAIVVPLRRRLDGDDAAADPGDEALVDRVGAAFREWKGARIERLAGDQAVAAFGRATIAATGSAGALRWVVDDGGVDCPDCDDNALAGPTRPGEAYPTGHVHPPAHAGCRCLIAPVTT